MGMVGTNGAPANGAPPPAEKVVFKINVPVEGELQFDTGRACSSPYDGDQVRFTLVDGRTMYVPPSVADEMERLEIVREVEFSITKQAIKSGNKQGTTWVVARADGWEPATGAPVKQTPVAENVPVAPGSPQTDQTRRLQNTTHVPSVSPADHYGELLEKVGKRAMDAVIAVEEHARSKGRAITFSEAQAQDIWISLFIQATGGRR